jgi:hypothetical protein
MKNKETKLIKAAFYTAVAVTVGGMDVTHG